MTDFAAYTFYVNRPDLLVRSLNAFPDLWPELTIVDNSPSGIDKVLSRREIPECIDIYRPPVPFTYTQSLNWMLLDSQDTWRRWSRPSKADFIIHFHSDATTTNPAAVQELLTYIRAAKAAGKRHGLWWTFYDVLFGINPEAVLSIGGWDPLFPSYFVDQDLRRRLMLTGWECVDTHIQGMSHEGSATINSDPKLQFENGRTFKFQSALYHDRWGGEPGHEVYLAPWNRPDLFGDMKPYGGVSL